jgi:polyhydroxyalkanoate synthesis regulator phasin
VFILAGLLCSVLDMSDAGAEQSTGPNDEERGVAESLRSAIERTMRATAGSAASSRERAAELLDEVVRRGQEARTGLTRRGQEAGVELARRGQEATGEVGRRLELLEQRLAELEARLETESSRQRGQSRPKNEGEAGPEPPSQPTPEG